MPAVVLFDLDGTLVETMQQFADVAALVMARHHGVDRAWARASYLETSGVPFFRQLDALLPGDPRNPAAAAEFERLKVQATAGCAPSAEAIATLRRLRRAGVAVAVSSNNFQDQVDAFARRCPAPLDAALGFGSGLAKGRPHVRAVCARLSCRPDEVIFVGDSLSDAALARDAGVPFVAKIGTFGAERFARAAPAAPRIARLGELCALLEIA